MTRWMIATCCIAACGGAPTSKPNPIPQARAPYTAAVVYNGWEMWIGNDEVPDLEEGDPTRMYGAFKSVKAAFAKADLPRNAPAGSQALLVTYADKPQIRVPLGPIANLTANAFGTQKDYYNTAGVELFRAVELAVDELEDAPPGRKFLIVVGDGNDTNNEEARRQLPLLAKRAQANNIEVISIVYKVRLSVDTDVTPALTSNTRSVTSTDTLESVLVRTLTRLGR